MRTGKITTRWARLAAGGALIVALWIAAPRVLGAPPAQTGTPLAYGDSVTGEITEAVPCVYYWFEGQAGDAITLDMQRTSGSLDGQLWLYLRDGESGADPAAFNDDRPSGGLNPLVETTLPATDWYTVGACRLQHENMRVTVGTFTLTLSGPDASGDADAASGGGTNEDGGVMGAATPTAGSSLTGDLFPASTATTPTTIMPTTGAPQITATPAASQDGNLTGDVFPTGTLEATEDAAAENSGETFPFGYVPLPDDAAQALPPDAVIPLAYDQPTAGYLWADQPERLHELPVGAGDVVVIEWQQPTDALQPRITVTTPDGSLIVRVDLPDVVHGVRLEFVAPDVPVVVIHVARFDGGMDGSQGGYTRLARQS